jgi:hypothetical protein
VRFLPARPPALNWPAVRWQEWGWAGGRQGAGREFDGRSLRQACRAGDCLQGCTFACALHAALISPAPPWPQPSALPRPGLPEASNFKVTKPQKPLGWFTGQAGSRQAGSGGRASGWRVRWQGFAPATSLVSVALCTQARGLEAQL